MRFLTQEILVVVMLVVTASFPSMVIADTSVSKQFNVPFKYAQGKKKFTARCSACHGEWGMGTKQGPPLMHRFYKPSHHADGAFYRAALKGVRAHHWKFGDMPRVPGIDTKELDLIIPFIRWLQRENGIH